MSTAGLPVRLENNPITAAIFEVRFEPQYEGLSELLPGMLFSSLGHAFPKVSPLPFSELPHPVRQTVPDWQYQAVRQMSSSDGRQSLNIASKAINVTLLDGYPGWEDFREAILKVIAAIADLGVIRQVTRYSLRYQNVLTSDVLQSVSELEVEVSLSGRKISEAGFNLRAELELGGGKLAVVQLGTGVAFGVSIQGTNKEVFGTMLDVDVMNLQPAKDFFAKGDEYVSALHDMEKQVFFGLLKDSVLNRLSPTWRS